MQFVLVNKTLLDKLHSLTKKVIASYRYLYTRKQAAELLGISKPAVVNLVKSKRLEEVEGSEGKEARLITHESIQRELERRRREGIKKRGRPSRREIEHLSQAPKA